MKQRIFKTVLSMVLVLCMAMPSSMLTAFAEESYVVVDDTVTDNTQEHYFTYTEAADASGLTGWASDTKTAIYAAGVTNSNGDDVAQTQHWVWNQTYSEAAKHTYSFTFKGTGVELIGVKNDAQNTFRLDDGEAETVTITGAAYTPVTLYSKTGLEYGVHTVYATLPEGGTGLQVCYAKVYGAATGGSEETEFDISGSIVDTDTQWTQKRYDAVKGMNTVSASLTAWKNDKAVSEIALISGKDALENVTVTASALTSRTGDTIAADCVTATFIKSTKAYNGAFLGYGSTTRAVPADNGTNRSESSDILWQTTPISMDANAVQPVWVEFDIPKDAAAGSYTAALTVTADNTDETLEFTYTIEVQDATLADAEEFVNTFDIMQWQYPYSSAEYYGVEAFSAEHLEILDSIMGIYKEIGGNAITATIMEEAWSGQTYSANDIHYPSMIQWTKNSDGSFSYDYSDFDAWIGFCKDMGLGEKIVLYGIAPWHNSFKYWENGSLTTETYTVGSTRYTQVWTDFLEKLIDHLEENGWFDNAYIGIDERGVSSTVLDVVESVTNDEGVSLKTASDIDNITSHWEIAQRVTDLNVGDTAAYNNSAKFAELLAIRKAKGYKTTLYSCTEHQPGQFSLSAPVESYWAVLNAGMMGADGFNRWAYDAWVADPLNDTTHNAFEPGDCFVIFPDEKDAENPTAKYSVRLARMAEGVRDVNKLAQIVKEVPSLSDEAEAVYDHIQYALRTNNSSYMSSSAVSQLSAETAGFKAALNELTENYILLRDGGTNEVDSVEITEGESLSMTMGTTQQLHTIVLPENLIDTTVVWSSSAENIVSVAQNGEITALQVGSAVITATSAVDAAKKAEIIVTVTPVVIDESKRVAYYSFDDASAGKLVNEWADDREGTIADSATFEKGKQGTALSVNTAGEGAVVTEDLSDLDGGDWTVGYWVKAASEFNQEISVLEDSSRAYSLSLMLASNRSNGGFRVGDGSGDVLTYKNYSFEKDTWYHLTWVQDKDTGLSLYVNGQLSETNTWPVSNSIKAPIEVIGGTGFTGLIDEVKIYNAVLTEAEIIASMQVKGINLPESSAEIYLEDTYQIEATVISDETDKTLTYTSADPSVAAVDENGLVTGVGRGTTTITIKNEAAGYEETITIKVSVEISIINELTKYVLPEKYQSDVEGPHADDASMRYLGQPDMVQTETGRLITVFPVGHGHGPLIMKYSDDEGETWTAMPNTPQSWEDSQETPTIYSLIMEDGSERLVLICACPGTWGNYTTGWDFSYSDDNGETWTEFEHFWSSFSNGTTNDVIVGMASLVQLKDEDGNYIQKWMGVYHNVNYVNYKTYLTFDEEGNPQWTEPVAYLSDYRSIESSHQICEVGMFRSPDGERIVALARNQTHSGPATMFYSDDEGETWSEPAELPGSLAGERHKALYDPVSGKLVITFREIIYDRNGNGVYEPSAAYGDWTAGDWVAWVGDYEDLMNLQQGDYMIVLDEDWAANTYSGDCGYTGMAVLADGTFVLHSYGHWNQAFSQSYVDSSTGGYNVKTDLCWIRQAKFSLAELEKELGIERPADRTALAAVIDTAEGLKEVDYTEESWAELAAALDAAKEVNDKEDAAQADVDAAAEALQAAIDALVEKDGPDVPGEEVCKIFTDVMHDSWYEEAVQYVYDKGLMEGNGDKFTPNGQMTRGMFVTTLYRLAGEPEITDDRALTELHDVAEGAWYADAVCWAYATGVTTGYENDMTFRTNVALSREQLATFLYRYAQYQEMDVSASDDLTGLLNADKVKPYAEKEVKWAVGAGMINGMEVKDEAGETVYDLAPQKTATRAQMAQILMRFCEAYDL